MLLYSSTLFTIGLILETTGIFLDAEGPSCGRPIIQHIHRRVIGGVEATPGSWPWIVMLTENNKTACGGSILNHRVVITAAHCFHSTTFLESPTIWRAYAGKHNLQLQDSSEHQYNLHRVVFHPGFNRTTLENDLALIVLSDDITFSEYIQPICLPPSDEMVVPVRTYCYVAGWGDTRGTGNQNVLNQARVPILHPYFCSSWYGVAFYKDVSFCAGYKSGVKDSCSGDSGGPLSCKSNDTWYLQGVTSWGWDCGQPHWPGVYVNVSVFANWIRTTAQTVGYPIAY